MVKIV